MDAQVVKTGTDWNMRLPRSVIVGLSHGDKVKLTEAGFGFVVSVRKPRDGWDKAFADSADTQDSEELIDLPNKFDQDDWQW